jgi:predicted site-specific integrase-resolvase
MSLHDNMQEDVFITIREAVRYSSLHPHTIRKYTDAGLLKCYRTPTGQRRIDKEDLQRICLHSTLPVKIPEIKRKPKVNYIYSRVSSKKQLDDLHRQTEFIRSNKPEYENYESIIDVASGINFKRKGLQAILESSMHGNLGELVVSHRDRLCRFGYDLINFIIERNGGRIVVIDDERHKSTEQELAEDLLSIVHIYSCRQMGKRKYTKHDKSIKSETEYDESPEEVIG